jgi:hypothetical protein
MEMLIDQLILYLPSEWFVDAPFLVILLSNPNGRYVLAGFLIVVGLIILWVFLLLAQVLLRGRLGRGKPVALQSKLVSNTGSDGFQFFKRNAASQLPNNIESALQTIEQEMLTVRQRYVDGNIIQDVYVAETRRLYSSAKALKP